MDRRETLGVNSHFLRLNWLPPFLCRYPEEDTPPGMVSRFWAPIALMGIGHDTSTAAMVLEDGRGKERKREEKRREEKRVE